MTTYRLNGPSKDLDLLSDCYKKSTENDFNRQI